MNKLKLPLLIISTILIIISIQLTSGQLVANLSTNVTYSTVEPQTDSIEGVVYVANVNQYLLRITKNAASTGQTCSVINNATGALLSQQNFVSNTCTVNTTLTAGTVYRIGVNASGTVNHIRTTATIPVVYPSYGNFSYGCFDGGCLQAGGTTFYNIESLFVSSASSPLEVFLNSPNASSQFISSNINFTGNVSSPFNGLNNATLQIWRSDGSIYNYTNKSISSNQNNTMFTIHNIGLGSYIWNIFACNLNHTCTNALSNRTFIQGVRENNNTFNFTAYQTGIEGFSTNITLSNGTTISSVLFYYNGTSYSGTSASLGGDDYRLSYGIDIDLILGIKNWFWSIMTSSGNINLTTQSQNVSLINLSICGASPQNVPYLNFTFYNETSSEERVNASVSTSTWSYWLGAGSINKSFTYSSSSENKEYSWCFSPPDRTVNTQVSFSYDNAESEQRTYDLGTPLILTNSTTLTSLFLLPSSQGQFVTFQVVNTAQQAIEGVTIVATRSGIGTIETKTTDASGSATMFLNPNFAYGLTFSKSGFTDFTTTITPTQTSYTITMGGSSSTNNTNPQTGISYTIYPLPGTLNNNTAYNFNFTLNSTYWTLDSWGFTLTNGSGFLFATNTSTSTNGGFLSRSLNTGLNETIVMNYFWVIDGEYNNATRVWGVIDLSDSGFSLFQLFTDLRTYVSLGFFGLDNFGLALITFIAIFMITGVTSYKFGINSPAALMALVFTLVLFFDFGLGLIPNPIGAIPHAATFLTAIIFIGMILREVGR